MSFPENTPTPIDESESIDHTINEIERVAKEVGKTGFLEEHEIISLQNRLSLIIHSDELQVSFTRQQIRRIDMALKIFPNFFSFSRVSEENALFLRTFISDLMIARQKIANLL